MHSISPRFRDGRSLQSLIDDLENRTVDPLTANTLILRVAKEDVRGGPPRYYTFDHRRLYCFWKAKVSAIRVRIIMDGRQFSEFARKCDSMGRTMDKLRVRWLAGSEFHRRTTTSNLRHPAGWVTQARRAFASAWLARCGRLHRLRRVTECHGRSRGHCRYQY